MMRLPPFEYLVPRTVAEAAGALAAHGPAAMVVAGGTDLYPNLKRRQFEPRVLVSLGAIADLAGVTGSAAAGFRIGAMTTLAAVAGHPALAADAPALATAAGLVSSPQLRNMGTLGGNVCVDTRCTWYNQTHEWRQAAGFCMKKDGAICLVAPGSDRCWAVSSSDTAPALAALGAEARVEGPAGARVVPLAALYRDDGIAYLAKRPDEIVTELRVPPTTGWRSAYLKLRRRGSFDFPVLGVAAALRLEDGVVAEARIVLGAVASLPRAATAAAGFLVGQRLDATVIGRAAELAAGPARPLDNADFAHFHRKRMTRVFVARALAGLAGLGPILSSAGSRAARPGEAAA